VNIADWLRGLGLEKYAPAFDENAINWDVLSELTTEVALSAVRAHRGSKVRIRSPPAASQLFGCGPEGTLRICSGSITEATPSQAR
jgi:hypothetical protein